MENAAPMGRFAYALAVFALIAFFLCACLWFGRVQNIWIDESTQLSGLTLAPADILAWLAGKDPNRFGVPGDRMPPLGYLLDRLWQGFDVGGVVAFRMFHALLVAAGILLVAIADRRFFRPGSLLAPVIFLALSPRLVMEAVELRAYPLFFLMSCIQLWLFLGLLESRRRPSMARFLIFAGVCGLAAYVHFFGVVSSCAYLGGLLFAHHRSAASRRNILLAIVIFGVVCLGLLPFARGAGGMSSPTHFARPGDWVHYLLELLGGSADLVIPWAGFLVLGSAGALIALGTYAACCRLWRGTALCSDWLVPVIALGVVATLAASLVIHSFEVLKPSYSLWLMPPVALLIGRGATQRFDGALWDRRLRWLFVIAMATGSATASGLVLAKRDWFVHGPSSAIERALATAPPQTAIVYLGADYAYGYFPMVYFTKGKMDQWLANGRSLHRIAMRGVGAPEPLPVLASYRSLVIVDLATRHFQDLRACWRGHCPQMPQAEVARQLIATGQWKSTESQRTFGYYDTRIENLVAVDRVNNAGLRR